MIRAGTPGGQVAAPSPWNLPNALTVLRILLVPVYGWLLLQHGGTDASLRWWAVLVFVLAMATDKVDGDLARSRGLVTDFGKIADPIADKALTGMALIGLSLVGDVPWWITVVVLVREWGITLMRFAVIRHGVMPAGRGGKLKTVLQSVALALFSAPLWTLPAPGVVTVLAWVVLVAAVVLTVVTGVEYVVQAHRLRAGSERTAQRRVRRQAAAAARAERAAAPSAVGPES